MQIKTQQKETKNFFQGGMSKKLQRATWENPKFFFFSMEKQNKMMEAATPRTIT